MLNLISIFSAVSLLCACSSGLPEGLEITGDGDVPLLSSDPAKLSLSFDLDGTARSLGKDTGLDTANEVIHLRLDLNANKDPSALQPVLSRKPLAAGLNQLELEKGSVHLVAFVENPGEASLRGARSTSSAIMTIGNLSLVTSNLHSIPVDADAAQGLDLGTLASGTSGFESQVDSAYTSLALGYEQELLASYGTFDGMMAKLIMNPDVDGNGIYDQDEDRRWIVSTLRYVQIQAGDVADDGTLQKPVDSLYNDLRQFTLVFWLGSSFAHPTDYSTVFLRFPLGSTYVPVSGGAPVAGINPNHDSPHEGPGGIYAQYYFNLSSAIASPAPPFVGDYALRIGADEYNFKSLDFIGTTQDSYQGFLIPVSTFTFDESDILQTVSWRWVVLRNGRYENPLPGEVELKMMQFYYYMPGFFIQPDEDRYYENGEADLRSYGIKRSDLGSSVDCDYWDRASNDYKFNNGL